MALLSVGKGMRDLYISLVGLDGIPMRLFLCSYKVNVTPRNKNKPKISFSEKSAGSTSGGIDKPQP